MPQNNIRFVPADPPAPRMEIIHSELPSAPITEPMPLSSHRDRALGFTLATAPLAGVASLVAALVAILGFQVPIVSLAALLVALGGFAVVWLIAYAHHVWVSPDGALLAHVLLAWAYLKREQKERHSRYGRK